MKRRPNPPPIVRDTVRDPHTFSRMIEGIVRTVEYVMDRPRRKPAKNAPAESRGLVSKSA